MANSIEELRAAGQSIWLDYIRRGLTRTGGLARMVEDGWITGVTSNPTIFRKAVAESQDYDDALAKLAAAGGRSPYEAYLEVCGEDIREAADVLHPVYDRTNAHDGYVSFEAQPADTAAIIAEAHRMFALVDRPNVMIKVPGIPEGVAAVQQLIADGVNVNITLLFDVDVYARFAEAYIAGLERRLAAGGRIDNVASVASFFVSRVDTKVDERLPQDSPLRGNVAIANARRAYALFQKMFAGPRWQKLAVAGAMVQRPLWASTGTKNPAYSDVLYVEELVAPHTVNTLPEATLLAFLDHGKVRPAIENGIEEAEQVLADAAKAGIDVTAVAAELLDEGIASFNKDFEALLETLEKALHQPSLSPRP